MYYLSNIKVDLLLTFLIAHMAAITITYQNTAATAYFYSSFTLAYTSSGANISVIVNPSSAANYNILFWRPGTTAPSQTPFQTAGPFVGAKVLAFNTPDVAGSWRVEVLPNGDDFVFEIKYFINNVLSGNFYGIASYGRVFSAYYGGGGPTLAQLSISSGSLDDIVFAAYGPFNSIAVTGGTPTLPTKTSSFNSSINFFAASNSFYYYVLKPKANVYTQNVLIRIAYQTDTFQCPYLNGATDYNSNFQGCSYSATTKGLPCLQYDFATGLCLACMAPFRVNQKGTCTYDTLCPDNHYYHYGSCLKAIDNCITFDKIGDGTCSLCKLGYNLVNYNNGTQLCDPITPNCTDNQYLVGKVCFKKVLNCSNFIQLTGTCKACSIGFDLINNTCVSKPVPPIIACPPGQIFVGTCQNSDPYCIYYGNSIKCQLCATGWELKDQGSTAVCKQIKCGKRQYSAKGICDDVSLFCDTFDAIYGTCSTCVPGYSLQADGTCIQASPGTTGDSSPQPCSYGYYLLGITCVQVSSLCQSYDYKTGLCTSCNDNTTYFLVSGICLNMLTTCANQPRTYFNKGSCVLVNRLCNDFNPLNGQCITCFDKTFLDQASGRCKYNETCKVSEYKAIDGNCIAGNANCTSFDQDTGACLTCKPGFDLNGNTCCRHQSYIDTAECKVFLKQNCAVGSYNDRYGCYSCDSFSTKPLAASGDQLFYSKCIPK